MTEAVRIVHITGGLPGDNPTHATIGREELSRDPGEPADAFEARALAVARAREADLVIIGGLPA